jgi:hypothetical protein
LKPSISRDFRYTGDLQSKKVEMGCCVRDKNEKSSITAIESMQRKSPGYGGIKRPLPQHMEEWPVHDVGQQEAEGAAS